MFSSLFGFAVPTHAQPNADVSAVSDGTVVTPGTLAVIEEVDFAAKTVVVAGGVLSYPFPVGVSGDVHRNAWVGYASAADAASGACQEAAERMTQPTFAGFSVTVVGHPECGNAAIAPQVPQTPRAPQAPYVPSQPAVPTAGVPGCSGPSVQAIRPGTTVPAGNAVIVREISWDSLEAWVWYTTSSQQPLFVGSGFDGNPHNERAVWAQCSGASWAWMETDANNEAVEICQGLLGRRDFRVYLNNQPYSCG